MARLILSLDGSVLAEYNMTKERYTIGRLPDNDVRIDNAAVSGLECFVRRQAGMCVSVALRLLSGVEIA